MRMELPFFSLRMDVALSAMGHHIGGMDQLTAICEGTLDPVGSEHGPDNGLVPPPGEGGGPDVC